MIFLKKHTTKNFYDFSFFIYVDKIINVLIDFSLSTSLSQNYLIKSKIVTKN